MGYSRRGQEKLSSERGRGRMPLICGFGVSILICVCLLILWVASLSDADELSCRVDELVSENQRLKDQRRALALSVERMKKLQEELVGENRLSKSVAMKGSSTAISSAVVGEKNSFDAARGNKQFGQCFLSWDKSPIDDKVEVWIRCVSQDGASTIRFRPDHDSLAVVFEMGTWFRRGAFKAKVRFDSDLAEDLSVSAGDGGKYLYFNCVDLRNEIPFVQKLKRAQKFAIEARGYIAEFDVSGFCDAVIFAQSNLGNSFINEFRCL